MPLDALAQVEDEDLAALLHVPVFSQQRLNAIGSPFDLGQPLEEGFVKAAAASASRADCPPRSRCA